MLFGETKIEEERRGMVIGGSKMGDLPLLKEFTSKKKWEDGSIFLKNSLRYINKKLKLIKSIL